VSGERARGTERLPVPAAQMERLACLVAAPCSADVAHGYAAGWRAGSGVPETLLGQLGTWFTLSLRSHNLTGGLAWVRSGQTGLQCSCPGVGWAEVRPARERLCINT